MRLMQGTFSSLPDLTDAEIGGQIQYAIDQGWAIAVEFTDDPQPRNVLWEMWGLPMFGIADAAAALELAREAIGPGDAILIKGSNSVGLSALVDALASRKS